MSTLSVSWLRSRKPDDQQGLAGKSRGGSLSSISLSPPSSCPYFCLFWARLPSVPARQWRDQSNGCRVLLTPLGNLQILLIINLSVPHFGWYMFSFFFSWYADSARGTLFNFFSSFSIQFPLLTSLKSQLENKTILGFPEGQSAPFVVP